MSGLTYHKVPGGFLIAQDDRDLGQLRYGEAGTARIIGVPWFTSRPFPTAFAARLALASAWVEEQILEEYGQ